jgi:hypothetical protein
VRPGDLVKRTSRAILSRGRSFAQNLFDFGDELILVDALTPFAQEVRKSRQLGGRRSRRRASGD